MFFCISDIYILYSIYLHIPSILYYLVSIWPHTPDRTHPQGAGGRGGRENPHYIYPLIYLLYMYILDIWYIYICIYILYLHTYPTGGRGRSPVSIYSFTPPYHLYPWTCRPIPFGGWGNREGCIIINFRVCIMYSYMYVCMYVCMHVCMYVCIYVCMYVCMYV